MTLELAMFDGEFLIGDDGEFVLDPGGDCCCVSTEICIGCSKWVSDVSGVPNAGTITVSGCGPDEQWTSLTDTAGNANCEGSQQFTAPQGTNFTEITFRIDWNPVTGKYEATVTTSFQNVDCSLGTPTEVDYECTECYFTISIEVPVIDGGTCHCAGPVTFKLEIDLSAGPDCISS